MPELPEVETVRKAVARLISGKSISQVRVLGKRVVKGASQGQMREKLLGKRIEGCLRRGKYLILRGADFLLLVHFGMSGSLIFFPRGRPPQKHTHLVIGFDDRSELHYHDPRTFGRIRLYPPRSFAQIPSLAELGPEPLNENLSWRTLGDAFCRRKAPIKQVIMDQRVIAGIGNIYASEILFHSSIHPQKAARDLTTPELKRLHKAIRKILRGAIEEGGTSIISFRDAEGKKGSYQELLQVYGHLKEECPRCHTLIRMQVMGGRSTFYCPKCQEK
jgi:formamidopyrimidine-DNA glycosylase